MATKTVYVSKGDLVRLRYIPDPNAPRTQAVWKERLRPTTQCFWVLEYDLIGVAPDLGVADVGLGGKIKGYLSTEPKMQAEIDDLKKDLAEAYKELRQQRPTVGAVFNRAVWDKADKGE